MKLHNPLTSKDPWIFLPAICILAYLLAIMLVLLGWLLVTISWLKPLLLVLCVGRVGWYFVTGR